MTTIEWLEHRIPGFAALGERERQAIFQFTVLWSLFEAKALSNRGSAQRIVETVQAAQANDRLRVQSYERSLEYFCSRYFVDGEPTYHFEHLHLRNGDQQELVKRVLSQQETLPTERVAALLIVVYRLRNNLFHGLKWAYDLQGQRENFENANMALIAAYEQMAPR